MGLKNLRPPAKLQEAPRASFPTSAKARLPRRRRKVLGRSEGWCLGDPQRGGGDGDVAGMLVGGECIPGGAGCSSVLRRWVGDAVGWPRGMPRGARYQPPGPGQLPPPAAPCGPNWVAGAQIQLRGRCWENPVGLSCYRPCGWVFGIRRLSSCRCGSGNPGTWRRGVRVSSCFAVINEMSVPGLCCDPSRCQPPRARGASGCSCLPRHCPAP